MKRDASGKFLKKEKPEVSGDQGGTDDQGVDKKPGDNDTGERTPMEKLTTIQEEIKTGTAKKKKPAAKKRGRPKKKPEPEPEPPPTFDVDAAMMKQGIKTLFNIAARNRGAHWQVEDEEIETLAQVTDAMAQKYFPLLGPWMVEINFFGALIMIVGPRVYTDMQIQKHLKAQQAAAQETNFTAHETTPQ